MSGQTRVTKLRMVTGVMAVSCLAGGCDFLSQPEGAGAGPILGDEDTVLSAIVDDSKFGEFELRAQKLEAVSNAWEFTVLARRPLSKEDLTFEWDFGDGSRATGSSHEHIFGLSGVYQVRVVAIDLRGTAAFLLTVTLEIPGGTNAQPIADAGDDQEVDEGTLVFLHGDRSGDPNSDELGYSWVQRDGPPVSLIDSGSDTASFIAPLVDTDVALEFQLTVSDAELSTSDLITVYVLDKPESGALALVADAGAEQMITEGDTVVLDGSASQGAGEPLTYAWSQITGPTVHLADPSAAVTSFVAPFIAVDSVDLVLVLLVQSGDVADADEVTITILDGQDGEVLESCLTDTDLDGTPDCDDGCPLDGNKIGPGFCGCGSPDTDANSNGIADCLDVDECAFDVDCDDDAFCNGVEVCVSGLCQSGSDPCSGQICDEVGDLCQPVQAAPLPIQVGDVWQYFEGVQEPPATWQSINFDGATWASGPSGIGYGDGDDATELGDMQGSYVSVYMRRDFHVEDASVLTTAMLSIDYDDGFVAFLNGTEVARSASMAGLGSPPPHDSVANTPDHEAGMPEAFDISGFLSVLVDGRNVLAIQAHNRSLDSSDFSVIPAMTVASGCVDDSDCDDGVYCNGVETCTIGTGQCASGAAPCAPAQCDEITDTCSVVFTCPVFDGGAQAGTLLRTDVLEASGLAASRQNADVLWTHDDSGGDNVVFALNVDGTFLGTYRLGAGSVQDAEDIALGPGPTSGIDYLFLADIGDNNSVRNSISIKRVAEPIVESGQAVVTATLGSVDVIQLQYPAGADAPSHKDSETLLVDTNGDIYLVTKRMTPNKVYRAQFPQSTSSMNTMEYVATLPTGAGMSWITAGDVSYDGRWIVMKSEQGADYASIWYRAAGASLWEAFDGERCLMTLQSEPQGEAVAWDSQGLGFFTVSEAHNPTEPVWYYTRQ